MDEATQNKIIAERELFNGISQRYDKFDRLMYSDIPRSSELSDAALKELYENLESEAECELVSKRIAKAAEDLERKIRVTRNVLKRFNLLSQTPKLRAWLASTEPMAAYESWRLLLTLNQLPSNARIGHDTVGWVPEEVWAEIEMHAADAEFRYHKKPKNYRIYQVLSVLLEIRGQAEWTLWMSERVKLAPWPRGKGTPGPSKV